MTQWNLWFRGSSGSSCYRPSSPGKWRQAHGALVWRQGNTPRRFNTSTKAGSLFFFKVGLCSRQCPEMSLSLAGCPQLSPGQGCHPWLGDRSAFDDVTGLGSVLPQSKILPIQSGGCTHTIVLYITAPSPKTRNYSCQTLLIHSPAWTYVLKPSVYHWTLAKYQTVVIKLPLNLPLEISVVCENTCQSVLGTYQICMHVLNEVFSLFLNATPPFLQGPDLTWSHFIPNTCLPSLTSTVPRLLKPGAEQPLRMFTSPVLLFWVYQCVSKYYW